VVTKKTQVPTFDIETVGWINPIAVGFFDGEKYHAFYKMDDTHDVIWEFLQFIGQYEGMRVWAHNASNFDNKFILSALYDRGQQVRFEAGMGKLVWVDKGITFEDSYLMMGRGLDAMCDVFGLEKKLDWDHNTTKFPWEMSLTPKEYNKFKAYLKRDCIVLSKLIYTFSAKMVDYFGILPSVTLSLSAAKAFDKRFCPMKSIASNERVEKFIRRATYGGRNEVYKRYGENLNLYDVRSMYTSCYDVPIPYTKLQWTNPNIDRGTMAEAKVHIPDTFVGPLPTRYRGRLIFPTGELQDWWDTRELKHAAEQGCDITIIRQLEADEEPLMESFGQYVGQLRKEEKESILWKLFGLRLVGKMGQQRWRSEIKHICDIENCVGWAPIDEKENYHERSIYVDGRKSPYIKPAVNMRIRAEARVRHSKYLLEAGDIYYSDTDSVHTTSTLPIGPDSGELQLVDQAKRGYFIRCKLYGYVTLHDELIQRSSGFRDYKMDEGDFKTLLAGGTLTRFYESPGDWKSILKGEGLKLVSTQRTIKGHLEFDNRKNFGTETEPLKVNTIKKVKSKQFIAENPLLRGKTSNPTEPESHHRKS